MIEDYNIRKTVAISDHNISLYFRDKDSDCFIPLLDLLQLCSNADYNVKDIKAMAGDANCDIIKTSADYTVKVCNKEGCNNILISVMDKEEAAKNVAKISDFIEQQKELLPDIAEQKEVDTVKSEKYFTMISVNGHSVRFVQVKDTRWFSVQDIVRFFSPLKAAVVEDQISLLDSKKIAIVQFPNHNIRKCIAEESFTDIVKVLLPDKADTVIAELKNAVQSTAVKISESAQGVKELSINGETTSILRYVYITIKGIKCAAYRHTQKNIIAFFSVSGMAAALKINATACLQRASTKKVKFVTHDDIFLTIKDLRSVFYGSVSAANICNSLSSDIKNSDIIDQVMEVTDPNEHVVLFDDKPAIKPKESEVKQRAPIVMSNGKYVILYDNVKINGYPVLVCFAKNDINNKQEIPEPWFWSTSLGYSFDINGITGIAGKYVDNDNKTKITIPDIKKFNVRVLTLNGIEQTLQNSKVLYKTEDIIVKIKEAVNAFVESSKNKELEGIKYEIRSRPVVEEKEKVMVKENKTEEDKQLPVVETAVTFRNTTIEMRVTADPKKGIALFYNLAQLLDSLATDEETKTKILQENQEFISIFDIEKKIIDIKDSGNIVQELLKQSRGEIQKAMVKLGVTPKSEQQQEQEQEEQQQPDADKNIRTYILRAIILAEKYRFILMTIKQQGKDIKGLPGPADQRLLEDLWRYIDIATMDQSMSFGFQRQLVIISERVKRLETLL